MNDERETSTELEIGFINRSIEEIKESLKLILAALQEASKAQGDNTLKVALLERDCLNCREKQAILIKNINSKIEELEKKPINSIRNWQSWLIIVFAAAAFIVALLALLK